MRASVECETAHCPCKMQRDEYLKLAEVEDRMWYFRSLHRHVEREFTVPNAALSPTADILDAGCGTGGLILAMRAGHPARRYHGIDFMPLACDLARNRCGPTVDIREASITELPFADESFDAVVSADVICQIEEPATAMAELFRVLRPGGRVLINVPAYMWMWSYHDESCQTKHRYTRPEMDRLLTGANFIERRLTHWNALPFPALFAKRKLFSSTGSSDVRLYPAPVEFGLRGAMSIEHAWLGLGGRFAWGTSILAAARRPLE